ncbi:MAG: hypothetical protein NPIRA05_08870 [Nitrospirales bacterium]|nr:MAG: hypothetical protein NPIRA05_08870 [Nitrospirales bacterium]
MGIPLIPIIFFSKFSLAEQPPDRDPIVEECLNLTFLGDPGDQVFESQIKTYRLKADRICKRAKRALKQEAINLESYYRKAQEGIQSQKKFLAAQFQQQNNHLEQAKQRIEKFQQIISGIDRDQVLSPTRKLRTSVQEDRGQTQEVIENLVALQLDVSKATNQALDKADKKIRHLEDKLFDYNTNWDSLHVVPKQSLLWQLMNLEQSEELPSGTKSYVNKFFESVPTYVTGQGPGPRDTLIVFTNIHRKAKDLSIRLSRLYVNQLFHFTQMQVNSVAKRHLIEQAAENFKAKLLNRLNVVELKKQATLNVGFGVILTTRSAIDMSIDTLSLSLIRLPTQFQELLRVELEAEIEELQQRKPHLTLSDASKRLRMWLPIFYQKIRKIPPQCKDQNQQTFISLDEWYGKVQDTFLRNESATPSDNPQHLEAEYLWHALNAAMEFCIQ